MKNKIEYKVCGQGNNSKVYEECEAFIKKWQEILRIQDWDITLEFLSANEIRNEMGKEGYQAFCERVYEIKEARIGIDIESNGVNNNLEETILHELLHIVTADYQWFAEECSVKDDRTLNILNLKLEQMVESLAKSFAKIGVQNEG